MNFSHDVTVIGAGRVGLPLALSLAKHGLRVTGIDSDNNILSSLDQGKMPFHETGCQELLDQHPLSVNADYSRVGDSEYLVITVGTPLKPNIEVDLCHVRKVIDQIIPYIRKGHCIILRSTVAPRVTEYIRRYLEKETGFKVGVGIFLAYCPERIAEGKALQELETLPQIIGAADKESARKAEKLFRVLVDDIFLTDYTSAELAKLFSNISRYIYFAVSNHFMIIADEFDVNIFEILKMTNHKYPRQIISDPGFTAGSCLRKDFGMINEHIPYTDLLINSWKVNEYIPQFLVSHLLKRSPLHEKTVAVMGYTFKKDSDDTRDSLTPKLIRCIQREVPKEIRVCEPHLEEGAALENGLRNQTLEAAVTGADVVFLSMNHSCFKDQLDRIHRLSKKETWFVDIWNLSGAEKIYYQGMEVGR